MHEGDKQPFSRRGKPSASGWGKGFLAKGRRGDSCYLDEFAETVLDSIEFTSVASVLCLLRSAI
jgi:hypothetical protein